MAFLLYALMIVSCGGGEVGPNKTPGTVYDVTDEVISNPERGFVHAWSVFSEGEPVSIEALNNLKKENLSMVWRVYYLEKFKDSPLSQAQLDLVKTDLQRMRTAGVKCIVRFAYTNSMEKDDAPYAVIEGHLDQLKPIFHEHADIMAFFQAGFIGAWGEWHSSSNNLTTLANKKLVINKLLEVLPKEVKIQLRTPLFKQEFFGETNAMDAEVGYSSDDMARIGFHNDCFMGSTDDYGTYQDVEAEKSYISQEALYVPTGGETCPPSGIPSASCTTAETEMSLLKWSYLNLDWYGPVLDVWRSNSCFEDFERKLGYRIALLSSELGAKAVPGGKYKLQILLGNFGYAPVYNRKNTFLVLKNKNDQTLHRVKLMFDIRRVIPRVEYLLEEEVSLSGIPVGEYELLLKIEDQFASLANRPDFNIQLANKSTWEEQTGMNKLLQTLTITQ